LIGNGVYAPSKSFVILPNYQWQRERFWFDELPSVGNSKKVASSYHAGENIYQYDWSPVKLKPVESTEAQILIIQGSGTLHDALSQGLYSNCEEVEITTDRKYSGGSIR
jgi:hypothetical protein